MMTFARQVVKESFLGAVKPDAFNEDMVFFLTDSQFGYAAVMAFLDDQQSVMVGMINGEIAHCTFNKAIKLHKAVSMEKLEVAEILSI